MSRSQQAQQLWREREVHDDAAPVASSHPGRTAPSSHRHDDDRYENGTYHLHLPLQSRPTERTTATTQPPHQTDRSRSRKPVERDASSRDPYHTRPPPPTAAHAQGAGGGEVQLSSLSQGSPSSLSTGLDLTLFADIQRTAELVREFKRLKEAGGTREERKALQRRVKSLRAEHEAAQREAYSPTTSAPATAPLSGRDVLPATASHTAAQPITTPGQFQPSRYADPSAGLAHSAGNDRILPSHSPQPSPGPGPGPGHAVPAASAEAIEEALAMEEQARVRRSMCFAIVLAESHVRHELQHKWERRWLKMKAACAEERVRIALAPSRGGATVSPVSTAQAPVSSRVEAPTATAAVTATASNDEADRQRVEAARRQADEDEEKAAAIRAAATAAAAAQASLEALARDETAARADVEQEEATDRQRHSLAARDARAAFLAAAQHQADLRDAVEDETRARAALGTQQDQSWTSLLSNAEESQRRAVAEAHDRQADLAREHASQRQNLAGTEAHARADVEAAEVQARAQCAAIVAATLAQDQQRESCVASEAAARQTLVQAEAPLREAIVSLAEEQARALTEAAEVAEAQQRLAAEKALRDQAQRAAEVEARAQEEQRKQQEEKEEAERRAAAETAHKRDVASALVAVADTLVSEASQLAAARFAEAARQRQDQLEQERAQQEEEEAAAAAAERAREQARQESEKAAAASAAAAALEYALTQLDSEEQDHRDVLENAASDATDALARQLAIINEEQRLRVAQDDERSAVDTEEATQRMALLALCEASQATADAAQRQREADEMETAQTVSAQRLALQAAVAAVCDAEMQAAVAEAARAHLSAIERVQAETAAAEAAEAEARAKEQEREKEEAAKAQAEAEAEAEAVRALARVQEEEQAEQEAARERARARDAADQATRAASETEEAARRQTVSDAEAAARCDITESARRAQAVLSEKADADAAAEEKREVVCELDDLAKGWIAQWIRDAQLSRPTTDPGKNAALDTSIAALSSVDDKDNDEDAESMDEHDEDAAAADTVSAEAQLRPPSPHVLLASCDAWLCEFLSDAAAVAATSAQGTQDAAGNPNDSMTLPIFSAADTAPTAEAATTATAAAPGRTEDAVDADGSHSNIHTNTNTSSTSDDDADDDDLDSSGNERSFETMSPVAAGALVQKALPASPSPSPEATAARGSAAASLSPSPESSSSGSVIELPAVVKDEPGVGSAPRRGSGPPLVSPRADSAEPHPPSEEEEVVAHSSTEASQQQQQHQQQQRCRMDPAVLGIAADAFLHAFVVDAARIQQQRTVDPSLPVCSSPRGGAVGRGGEAVLLLLDSDVAQVVAEFVVSGAGPALQRGLGLSRGDGGGRELCEVRESEFAAPLYAGMEQAVLEKNRQAVASAVASAAAAAVAAAAARASDASETSERPAPGQAAKRLPDEWNRALHALAERLGADAFHYISQQYLRALDATGFHGEGLFLTNEMEQRVHHSVDVVDVFQHHVSPHDCRFLALHCLDCVRRGSDIVEPAVSHSQRILQENLFQRPAQGCVVGAPTTGAAQLLTQESSEASGSGVRRARQRVLPPPMDVRRAGLTQMVLEHALENVLQDVLLDTTAWVASIL